MRILNLLMAFLLSLFSLKSLWAQTQISIVEELRSFTKAEAVTAAPGKFAASYYNPADLHYSEFNFGVISTQARTDQNNAKVYQGKSKQNSFTIANEIAGIQTSNKLTHTSGGVEVADLYFPHFNFKTFVTARNTTQQIGTTTVDSYNVNFRLRGGAIMGIAAKFGPIAIGYSHYFIKQAGFNATPSTSQLSTIQSAALANTLTNATTDFASFTTVNYGEANGGNAGFLLRPFKDNLTGIGVSVLNIGDTTFKDSTSLIDGEIRDIEDSARNEARDFGLTINRPNKIPQLINAGIHLSARNEQDGIFNASLSVDYNDIGGDTLSHKLAFASELGIDLAPKMAHILSLPLTIRSHEMHFGFRKLNLIAGYRPGEIINYGAEFSFHFLYNKYVSWAKLDVTGMRSQSLKEESFPDTYGIKVFLGINVMF